MRKKKPPESKALPHTADPEMEGAKNQWVWERHPQEIRYQEHRCSTATFTWASEPHF